MGNEVEGKWRIRVNEKYKMGPEISIRGTLEVLKQSINEGDKREIISLGQGDPSVFPCFRTTQAAEVALIDSVQSAKFNSYVSLVGILPARRSVAEYLSRDLPYKLSPDDVFITSGCRQAIEVAMSVLAYPGANILVPRPGYPRYESSASFCNLEVRHFDLLPDKGWEIDLSAVEALADENTVAIAIINPGNPCGNVWSYQHLKKVAETARRLGIIVIADEVYGHLTFGNKPFVPMGIFGSIAPVLTLGSLSKRWLLPGWRLGWLAITDPNGVLKKTEIVECIKQCLDMSSNPSSVIQAAVPHILENTEDSFFSRIRDLLCQTADICYTEIKEMGCFTCPQKPDGSMFIMVKLNVSVMEDILDDTDFCVKLAKEESVLIMPGRVVGAENWLRITFAIDPSSLKDAMERLKSFCERHAKSTK